MRLTVAWVFLALSLLGGCSRIGAPGSRPQAAPLPVQAPAPIPVPTPPNGVDANASGPVVEQISIYRDGPGSGYGHGVMPGINEVNVPAGSEVTVGSGEVLVTWHMRKGTYTESVQPRVRSEGPTAATLNEVMEAGVIQARFEPGGPERWAVWLEGIDQSRVVMVRRAEPVVTLGYRLGGGPLTMVEGLELPLPPGALTLEVFFDQLMDRASLRRVEQSSGTAAVEWEWVSDRQARASFGQVPDRLQLDFAAFQAATGLLAVPRSLLVVNADTAPYLERVSLADGTRQRLLNLPTDIVEVYPAPDGKRLAFRGWEIRPELGNGWWPTGVSVVDLVSGKLVRAEMKAHQLAWQSMISLLSIGSGLWGQEPGWQSWAVDGTRKPVSHEGLGRFAAVSPDGRYGAYLGPGREVGNERLANPLIIEHLTTGERKSLPDFVSGWYIGKDGDWSQWVSWSPDGQTVAALDPVERSLKPDLVLFDLRSGQRRVALTDTGVSAWGTRLVWSPDGRSLLAMRSGQPPRVIRLDGTTGPELPGWGLAGAFWHADSHRILTATGPWEDVFVFNVSTGARVDLGKGLPAGWDGEAVYVVRWAASDQRLVIHGP